MKNRIKEMLEAKGMTQRELAIKIGTTETTVCRYVNGNRAPKAPIAIAIAKALGTTVEELYPEATK